MGREGRARQRAQGRRVQPYPVAEQRPAAHGYVLALQRSAGNQAVGRILGRPSGPVLQRWPYVVQAGYMSGDMFGISAALVLNPKAGVVILQEGSETEAAKREPDQSALFKDFYTASLRTSGLRPDQIANRIKVVKVNDARAVYKDLLDGGAVHGATVRSNARLQSSDTFVAPGIATSMVGEAYEKNVGEARGEVAKAWTTGGPPELELKKFLIERGLNPGQKYALLWVRLSAKIKMGGAHPELDTSQQGVRDLKNAILTQTGRQVVVVGDDPGKPELTEGAINLLEFWNQPPFSTMTDRVEKRMAQLKLFNYMVKSGFDLVSIGMRSGAMEGPALLGVPTVYIEEAGNQQAERMEKWKGKVPGWTQASVRKLPTRTGRNFQLNDNISLPMREERLRGATTAVSQLVPGGFETVRSRLIGAYDEDLGAFTQRATDALGGNPVRGNLPAALATWHGHYTTWSAADGACLDEEYILCQELAGDEEMVRRVLSGIPTALDLNAGLADFARDVATAYGKTGEQRTITKMPPNLRNGLRKWRSAYTGKAQLAKGFDAADLELIMGTPKLKRDRFEHANAALMSQIDTKLQEDPGTTLHRVRVLMAGPTAPTLPVFRGNVLDNSARGLKRKFRLHPIIADLGKVQTAFAAYTNTPEGRTWWAGLQQDLRQLHAAAWPG